MSKVNNLEDKASGIRLLVSDVDGVLTNGAIVYDDHGTELKFFNVKDGLIIKHLKKHGIAVGVITGRDSRVVRKRCEELRMDFHLHGILDKGNALRSRIQEMGLKLDQVAYIGDDINDLPILSICGLSCAPADAPAYIKNRVDMVTDSRGGEGVFREVADFILTSRQLMDRIIEENS